MHSITFTCETITPMFLSGADGQKPELRAPSIKGALRFWWRALNGHLSLEVLKEQEGKIFGSTDRRSRVVVRVFGAKECEATTGFMLPHKDQAIAPCFKTKQSFQVQFSLPKMYLSTIKNLFILTTTLGGFGKRNRRGFGSIKITAIDGESFNIEQNLEGIIKYLDNKNYFFLDEKTHKIKSKEQKNNDYPYVKEIQISESEYNNYEDILIKIGKSTHENSDKSNGHGGRFASPVYISVIEILDNYKIIVTTLNNTEYKSKNKNQNLANSCLI